MNDSRLILQLCRRCTNRPSLPFARTAARPYASYTGIHNQPAFVASKSASSPFPNHRKRLWRTLGFVTLTSGIVFLWAAERTNWDTATQEKVLNSNQRQKALVAKAWGNNAWPTSEDLNRARTESSRQGIVKLLNWTKWKSEQLSRFVIITGESWIHQSEAYRTCVLLIGVQSVVFLAWQFRRLQPFMAKNFLSHPLTNRAYTNLTSVFSHSSLLHFGFNSIAFLSIGTSAHAYFWAMDRRRTDIKSSTARYEFLAFFVAAGLASSATSSLYSILVRIPRLIKAAGAAATPQGLSSSLLPSLGASGAIWASLSVTALAFPDAQVALIFLPFFSFPIGLGVASMAALDLVGLIRGWRFFDHAAHLGGALFGVAYWYTGHIWFVKLRKLMWTEELEK